MTPNKRNLSVFCEDLEKLKALKINRDPPPIPKYSRGRPPSDKESLAEAFSRAVNALLKETTKS